MSKAIFFDWDDTLALKLRGGEVLAARKEFGDSLVLIDDGENKNYTTTDIINLLEDITKSNHKWFIVSCGNNNNQLIKLKEQALKMGKNINATDEVWLNLGMRCDGNDKLEATTELIGKHFGGNLPDDSLFVDDSKDNLDTIKGSLSQIIPIRPGEGENQGPVMSTDGSGRIDVIHATFFLSIADIKYPKNLLIKDKVNQIRSILNLPEEEIGAPDLSKRLSDLNKTLDMFRSKGYHTSDLEAQIAELQTQVGMPSAAAPASVAAAPASVAAAPAAAFLAEHSHKRPQTVAEEEAALAEAIRLSQQDLESMRQPEPELEPSSMHSQGAMSSNKESIMARLHDAITLHSFAEVKKDKDAVMENIKQLKAELAEIERDERMALPSSSPDDPDYKEMLWVDVQNSEAVAKLSSYKNMLAINKLLHSKTGYTRDVKKAIMDMLSLYFSTHFFEQSNVPLNPQAQQAARFEARKRGKSAARQVFNVFMATVWHHGKTKMDFFPLSKWREYLHALQYPMHGGVELTELTDVHREILAILDNPINYIGKNYLEVYDEPHMGDL